MGSAIWAQVGMVVCGMLAIACGFMVVWIAMEIEAGKQVFSGYIPWTLRQRTIDARYQDLLRLVRAGHMQPDSAIDEMDHLLGCLAYHHIPCIPSVDRGRMVREFFDAASKYQADLARATLDSEQRRYYG